MMRVTLTAAVARVAQIDGPEASTSAAEGPFPALAGLALDFLVFTASV